jgi:hypothetical protein
MKRQGNVTAQKVNNHKTEDLKDSEGDEISISQHQKN